MNGYGEGNAIRLYIGAADALLPAGTYTYRIAYRTTRQLGFFAEHDELYWNVTGNDWKFPMDQVEAVVTLPPGVPADRVRQEAYTGPKGAKGKDYRAALAPGGAAQFATTQPLGVGEGLTVVVTFPKGYVRPPSAAETLRSLLASNAMALLGLVGMAALLVYFVAVWTLFGRDPPKGIVIPLFEPPRGLCPAAVRYVRRMGYDPTCFTAALIGMAVKGRLKIEDRDKSYALDQVSGGADSALSAGEQAVERKLFEGVAHVAMQNTNHARFQAAAKALKAALKAGHEGRTFFSNTKWMLPGLAISVVTLAGIALLGVFAEKRPEIAFLCVWLTGWSFGVFFLLRTAAAAWGRAGTGCMPTAAALFTTLFAVPFCAAEVVVLGILSWMTSLWLIPCLAVMGTLNALFVKLLKKPTVEGRRIMDAVEGYRMYLGTAEQDLLEAAHPPEKTPEVFERNLPYAIALQVENAWARKFADVLRRAAAEQGYSPGWYSGTAWTAAGAAGFASALGESFSSALSSASTAPGSSSGSGGGGSSGGGGGGGGGGGW